MISPGCSHCRLSAITGRKCDAHGTYENIPSEANGLPVDPKPGEREYYTHRQTGDLGWKVTRDGREMVKLDRPAYDDVRPFSDNEWVRKADLRPLIPAQVAQIAWVADRKLLLYLQQPEASKREWHELSEEKRKEWMERGPAKEGIRKMLWRGIMKTLEPLVEK